MPTRTPVLALALLLPACGEPAADPTATPAVVATIHPLASITRWILADAAPIRTLLPAGANPDTWEPTPRLAQAVALAPLVIRVGGAADAWVGQVPRSVSMTDRVRLKEDNPHVWLDPVLVRDHLLPVLTDSLAATYPSSSGVIRERGAAYADSLAALDEEIRRILEPAPRRRFIAAHPAWLYFADRYGLEQVGVLHPSPGQELGTRELARLVEEARRLDVGAVIAEPQLGRAGVDALADELDLEVAVADPVGGEGVAGREDYLSLMRFNARAFARALGVP